MVRATFFTEFPDMNTATQIASIVYPEVLGDTAPVTAGKAINLFETLEGHRKLQLADRREVLAFGSINSAHLLNGVVHLESICVRPDKQGQGLGRETVELLASEAEGMGAHAVVLDSLPTSADFYKRLGFINLGNDPLRFFKELS